MAWRPDTARLRARIAERLERAGHPWPRRAAAALEERGRLGLDRTTFARVAQRGEATIADVEDGRIAAGADPAVRVGSYRGAMNATPIELALTSGRIAGHQWGSPGARLTICVPGLSQDDRSFDYLAPLVGSADRHVVAIAPRGRGHSECTPAGTYGWPAHAADVLEIASKLGHDDFDLIGWSFGGFVSMQAIAIAPERIGRVAFLDVVGRPDASAVGPILAGLERLGAVYPAVSDYVEQVLASGGMVDCEALWRTHLIGDLIATADGFTTRTNKAAVLEDAAYGGAHDPYQLWPTLTMPALLLRAHKPVLPGLGHVVTAADAERFVRELPHAEVVDVDTNHYCIGMVETTAAAINRFLTSR